MLAETLKLFRQAFFVAGATQKSEFPDSPLPEMAFIGRSNVGKSSLINAITDNARLARISKSPGCTRQINFFQIASLFMLVDLPGYGYAKASGSDIKKWVNCMIDYLRERSQLKKIFLLIDARIGIGKYDLEMIELLGSFGTICQIVLTKFDKVPAAERGQVIKAAQDIAVKYAILRQEILTSSGRNKQADEVKHEILNLLGVHHV